MTSHGGFDGCMVDRWTRTPFKRQPGYTKASISAYKAAMQVSESLLFFFPPGTVKQRRKQRVKPSSNRKEKSTTDPPNKCKSQLEK